MISINLNDITILNIKSTGYRFFVSRSSKNEAISLMQNAEQRAEHLKQKFYHISKWVKKF